MQKKLTPPPQKKKKKQCRNFYIVHFLSVNFLEDQRTTEEDKKFWLVKNGKRTDRTRWKAKE